MNVDELIEIAIANADDRRVEVVSLEPAVIATEAVSGLAQLVAELVDNALAFSEPDDVVRLSGLFDRDDYLISVADSGVGIPDHFIKALNRALEDPKVHIGGPEPRLGIQLVARLAARHGIRVGLVPAMPGTTARAIVPARLVGRVATEGERERGIFAEATTAVHEMALAGAPRTIPTGVGRTIDLTRYETRPSTEVGDSVEVDKPIEVGEPAPAEPTAVDVEEFLEQVFAPLAEGPAVSKRPAGRPDVPDVGVRSQPAERSSATTLRVRVPGENFPLSDDVPSTAAGEGAVDIRKALSSYETGRRSAADEL